jgi:carbon-monoxide dehydrogenase large subunit/6-hydroxypseudooxynicotine dehydrogenase subunit gamma
VRVADMAAGLLLGPYQVPAYRVQGHYRLTNKTGAGTYRSPGRYESSFVRERLFDAIAERLGMDPITLRRRNLIASTDMPYSRPLDALGVDVILDSGDYAQLLDKSLERMNWVALNQELSARRAKGELVGVGLAMFVEKSGLGPSDGVHLTVDVTGCVELVTGAGSVGQGMETALAQICAQELGVDYRTIRVVHGRTDLIEFGNGAHASRVTVMSGSATQIAAQEVRRKAIVAAAQMLKLPTEELVLTHGRVHLRGQPQGVSVSLGDIARHLHPSSPHVNTASPGLSAQGWFYSKHMNYPYGIHAAMVHIDRGTGGVTVEKYWVAYDVGRAVNPMLIKGQIMGGLAQGLGGALFEQFIYDEGGQPLSTNFADYAMLTAREMPLVDVLITEDAPSPLNPLGMKGAGEAGTNAVGAAVAAAVDQALGSPGFVKQLPVEPRHIRRHLRQSSH